MAGRIFENFNYDSFELCQLNRPIHNNSRLKASMKKYGWLDAYPAHVVKERGKKLIKAGHHRFVIAQELGLPIKYVVCNDHLSLDDLEKTHSRWSSPDYLYAYVQQKNPEYIALKNFHGKTKIGLMVCVALMTGNLNVAASASAAYKGGRFKITTAQHANNVGDMILFCATLGFKEAKDNRFVAAISRVLLIEDIDTARLRSKLQWQVASLKPQVSMKDYLGLLEEIYNKGTDTKIPLSFLAQNIKKNNINKG